MRPLLPERLRPLDRPRLWVELIFTVGRYLALQPDPPVCARAPDCRPAPGAQVLHAERRLHVNIELCSTTPPTR